MHNKNLITTLILLFIIHSHAQEPTPATEAGEDFDLNAVMSVMETAEDLSDLEKKINDSESQINNLDLNNDDEIDIVKIVEFDQNNIRVLALRAVIGENDFQDIATIEIEKHSDTDISLQIIGDPDLYGPDYILEPAPENSDNSNQGGGDSFQDQNENYPVINLYRDIYLPAHESMEPVDSERKESGLNSEYTEFVEALNLAVFVSVHRWRPIRPLFVAGRVAFVSAVVWRPLPVWFVVRRPIARSTWRSRSRRYRNNRYRSTRNRHSRNASKIYSNNRKKSATAHKNVGPKPAAGKNSAPSVKTQNNKTATGYTQLQKSNSSVNNKTSSTSKTKGTTKKPGSGKVPKKHY